MVIVAIFILFLTIVILLGDSRLRLIAKFSLTLLGLGLILPDTYSIKSRVIAVNSLLLPAVPLPKSFLNVVMVVATAVLCLLIYRQLNQMKTKN